MADGLRALVAANLVTTSDARYDMLQTVREYAAERLELNPANLWGNFNTPFNYEGPCVAVDYVDIEGPLHDSWPPASHRRRREQSGGPESEDSRPSEMVDPRPSRRDDQPQGPVE